MQFGPVRVECLTDSPPWFADGLRKFTAHNTLCHLGSSPAICLCPSGMFERLYAFVAPPAEKVHGRSSDRTGAIRANRAEGSALLHHDAATVDGLSGSDDPAMAALGDFDSYG